MMYGILSIGSSFKVTGYTQLLDLECLLLKSSLISGHATARRKGSWAVGKRAHLFRQATQGIQMRGHFSLHIVAAQGFASPDSVLLEVSPDRSSGLSSGL